jgi:hypothetical protein
MVLTQQFRFAIHYKVVRMAIPHLIGIPDFQKKKKKWAIGWFFGFLLVLTQGFRFAIHDKVVRMTILHLIGIADFQKEKPKWVIG